MDRAAARPTAQLARMAGMASASPVSAKSPASTAASGLPVVRLELRHGAARPTSYDLSDVSFLIGSVPGCDLRLPGVNLPPVLCLIARQPGAVTLRKLAPALPLLVNGQPAAFATLAHGDRLTLGAVDVLVQIADAAPMASARKKESTAPSPQPSATFDERESLSLIHI